jgi:hypothetical protein
MAAAGWRYDHADFPSLRGGEPERLTLPGPAARPPPPADNPNGDLLSLQIMQPQQPQPPMPQQPPTLQMRPMPQMPQMPQMRLQPPKLGQLQLPQLQLWYEDASGTVHFLLAGAVMPGDVEKCGVVQGGTLVGFKSLC